MSRPTIIINDLDAERIDILLEQPPMLVCQSPTR
ncbi:regulator of nucleoside diphosphate kinase [Escherichia coli]|uniref:Regulator of nucleoside diphosphate kinase n=1 Tax=Escherichia coli TaxID=562 RepID=A0A2X1LTH2_ECOLX|nr:regulator of nucleoside diphosphate kinase [Escherichia coli]